ncbi:MAG: tRNA (guanine-N(1)-)-methyltransferase, tRNA (guanine-N1-)-methyltransferase [Candidatus Moranbacteria bacterium GW2011_GWC1_45_18]|nr:MAG: tRNA (guanine-N(1)-)-methyltransferase [Candidatus Moranbacteria bacterium GW2011_GWC2_40_12]KKT32748.1 MAG: tRNA (guanine-N(1)-)-methyltransferase [Candidatus Moranbacteria bacterium GW2011_GWF2_44_10]KKT72176.1 MAG: tRNA (guanine-N(1)-)-methyltransferase [Candidatus Moranbacteria bacterium GW2011_GWF1_44_4]KKT99136.1 MAG: tRNA (guanine-N(1)-)-methyltransferase, tRNA (guanine-N1-)-methyltransferase [Candidatus Moranbacteria bacterium GW2011_GWC1_45_18]OGI24726.1 MAG: tRNA (guanosine(37
MTFHIVTIFPKIFDSYFGESIVNRAQKKGKIKIKVHNPRDYAADKHKTVDDTPYGGGPGMIMKVEPIYKCLEKIKSEIKNFSKVRPFPSSSKALGIPQGQTLKNSSKSNFFGISQSRTLLFSAKGKEYTQADAKRLAKYENIIMICGRYEGVDERVAKHLADEEISIGDYILTGGEIPAMAVVDSVTRLLPEVLGNKESATKESFSKKGYLEHPQYTRPAEFHGWKVPEVLLSGDHKEIEEWRKENAKIKMQKSK